MFSGGWGNRNLVGVIFLGGENEQIFGWWEELPSMENPVMCYFWVYMIQVNQVAKFFRFQYHENYFRYKVLFLNVVKCSCKLQFDHVIFFELSQACPKCSEKISNTNFDERFGPSVRFFGFK